MVNSREKKISNESKRQLGDKVLLKVLCKLDAIRTYNTTKD